MAKAIDDMTARLFWGAVSGATGTTVLNVVGYGDMLVRGRSASSVPAKMAGILADRLGIAPRRSNNEEPSAQNRREAAGALLGYATGVGVGVGYGAVRARVDSVPRAGASLLLGLTAMATSDLSMALLGVSDPRTWSAADWLSDLIPHLSYGLAAAATFDACSSARRSEPPTEETPTRVSL